MQKIDAFRPTDADEALKEQYWNRLRCFDNCDKVFFSMKNKIDLVFHIKAEEKHSV